MANKLCVVKKVKSLQLDQAIQVVVVMVMGNKIKVVVVMVMDNKIKTRLIWSNLSENKQRTTFDVLDI